MIKRLRLRIIGVLVTINLMLMITIIVPPRTSTSLHTPIDTASRITIKLVAPTSIQAGDSWELSVIVPGANAGEVVNATLFNGLHHHQLLLKLGTGGIALWQFPKNTLIYAGTSLLTVRYQDVELQRALHVLPTKARTAELMTTSNNLAAYGEQQALLMALLADEWGNPPSLNTEIRAEVQFPNTQRKPLKFTYANGIAWSPMRSMGEPGRVRVTLAVDDANSYLEINQIAAAPANIALELFPECILSDGRDIVTLTAEVRDAFGYSVADGTLVAFSWNEGESYALTLDGRAKLRLPAPTTFGDVTYSAHSGGAQPASAVLKVVQDGC